VDRRVRQRQLGSSDRAIELLNPTARAKRLSDLVRDDRRPILICACPDIAVCHRAQVATFLHERFGWEVEHLPTSGKVLKSWRGLFTICRGSSVS